MSSGNTAGAAKKGKKMNPEDFRFENCVYVDSAYLEELFKAVREASPPRPDCVCVVAKGNSCFTGDNVGFECGHWFNWRETSAWFHTENDSADIWCPKCLIEEIRAGRAILNRDELKAAMASTNWVYAEFDPRGGISGAV